MRTLLSLIITGAAVTCALSSPLDQRYIGQSVAGITARSVAMGGTGLTGPASPLEALRNPARYSASEKGLQVEVTGLFPNTVESRSFPIYDSFDGVLAYNQYVSNSMGSAQFAGAATVGLKSETGAEWRFAVATYPVAAYDYTFEEEIRNRYFNGGVQDKVIGRVVDKTTGTRQWTGVAVAGRFNDAIRFGVSSGLITGQIKDEYNFWRTTPTDTAYTVDATRVPDNAHLETILGVTAQLNERLTAGFTATLRGDRNEKVTLDSSTSTKQNFVVERAYPMSMAVGFEYIPGQMLRSRFTMEAEWTGWAGVAIDPSKPELDNTVEVRAGVEHRVLPEVPVRFGYRFVPSPVSRELQRSYLSAGTGYDHNGWSSSFGVEFGYLNSEGPDPVADNLFGGLVRRDMDRIQDRELRFIAGVSYNFAVRGN